MHSYHIATWQKKVERERERETDTERWRKESKALNGEGMLWGTFYVPDTTSLFNNLGDPVILYYSHFTDKDTDTEEGYVYA